MTSVTCDSDFSTFRSSAGRALSRFSSFGLISSESISVSIEPNRKAAFRQFSFFIGVKRLSMIACATPSSSGGASPVTPKVPSDMPRPARPAIWANSLGAKGRIRRPSNLVSEENAT